MSVVPLHLEIREATRDDDDLVVALWNSCGLVTSWNPPHAEIERLRGTGHGALLVGEESPMGLVASVMVGHDGHRGWLYYLAVDQKRRRRGYGRSMVAAAERWLGERGLVKCQLMLRPGNGEAEAFYRVLGYELSSCSVIQRWLVPPATTDRSGKRDITVTYLEMDQRPVRAPVASPSVPHAIMRLHQPDPAFYRFMHDTIGRRWLWYERRLLNPDALRVIIHDDAVEVFVLYVRGNPAGFAEIDRREPRVANIRFLGLMEAHIGRGLGRYLLDWAVDQSWQGGTDKVTVNTSTLDHPRALSLYQRAGFKPVRRVSNSVDDPELIIRRQERAGTAHIPDAL